MARTRPYTIAFSGISVAAVQDLLALYCGAAMGVELHGLVIGQITGTTVANLRLSIKRLAAAVTAGSGGSAATPQKLMRGDGAAAVTARVNDTVQASSVTTAVLHSDAFNTVNGFQFFWPPGDMPTIGLSEAAVISLDTAPAAAMTMSGTLYFAELF